MGRPSTKRANVLLTVGAALLIVGIAVAASVGRAGDDDQDDATVPVLVARADLEVGALGDDLVSAGKVGIDRVPASEVPADALTSTRALSGAVVTRPVAEGSDVTAEAIAPSTLRSGALTIPKGKQAIAITVDATAGGGGYAGAGDHVDLYAVIPPDAPGAPVSPMTKLLLSDVEVLDVSSEVAPRRGTPTAAEDTTTTSRATEGRITLLLALSPEDAEQAIFATSFNDLYVTVLREGAEESSTDGVTYEDGYVGSGS